jgi:hypothetical protein
MADSMTDDQPMTGAEFRRHVGLDPARWAEQFLAAYARAEPLFGASAAERQAFVADWFRSAMKAAAATAEAGWMEVAKRRDQDEA